MLTRHLKKLFIILLGFLAHFPLASAYSIVGPYPGCPIDGYENINSDQRLKGSDSIVDSDDARFSLASTRRVTVSTESISMSANQILYLGSPDNIELSGAAHIKQKDIDIYGDKLIYNRSKQKANFTDSYILYQGFRFWSEEALIQANRDMLYEDVTFSRCAGAYDDLDWEVRASEVAYDKEGNSLTLYNSHLSFFNVPVFYVPWVNIPLSRRSGLLFPKIGQKALSSYDWEGYFYSQPVFVNLGDNMDVSSKFSWLQGRSILFSNQFRYLSKRSNVELNYDWKESDEVLEKVQQEAEDYRRLTINTNSKLSPHWQLSVQRMDLSPRIFHELFPNTLLERSQTGSFNQQIQLKGDYGEHKYDARVYQNLSLKDESADSYVGLPALSYSYAKKLSKNQTISLGLGGARFVKPEQRNLRNYQYAQIKPAWKWRDFRGFYQTYAELGLYQSYYQIDEFTDDSDVFDPSQTVDYASGYAKLGAELHFRNTQTWFPSSVQGKLSPILYYIYSPYSDPASIPFASYFAKNIDAFRSLLEINRYNREDFIGESNRIVSGLSQSFYSNQWSLRATLGKNTDIAEPTTNNSLPLFDRAFAYWFGELAYNYGLFRANLNTQWENLEDQSPKRIFSQLYYEDELKNVFRLNYSRHVTQATVESLHSSLTEYIGFGVLTRWNAFRFAYQTDYRLSNDKINNYLLGLTYDSCCWQLSSVIDATASTENPAELNYVINLGLTFKGLVAVGPAADANQTIYKAVSGSR